MSFYSFIDMRGKVLSNILMCTYRRKFFNVRSPRTVLDYLQHALCELLELGLLLHLADVRGHQPIEVQGYMVEAALLTKVHCADESFAVPISSRQQRVLCGP